MKAYYETTTGRLYNSDCLEVLKEMPDQSIALVLTDPPYNLGIDYGEKTDDKREDYSEWILKRFMECRRIGKALVITPGIANSRIYPKPDWTACWNKHGSPSRCPVGFNAWEPILIYGKRQATERTDVFDATLDSLPSAEGHPCPKPVKLFSELITHYSKPGDTVLDPFFGSGTTAIACEKTRRRWIGIEINEEFCKLIVPRIQKWQGQARLGVEL